jgi:flavin-dependent dehydrogenase
MISYYPEAKILSTFACLLPSATNPDFFKEKCAGKDWVLIGDSAGHTDPISGEGILYALWSAKLAARSIKNNELDSYDKSWKKEYGNYLIERCKMKTIAYGPLGIVGNMINFLAGNNEFY